jgi:hypothetical protein
MKPIRPQIRPEPPRTVDGVTAPSPRLTLSGALLLASGLSAFLLVAMTGFTFAMTMVWPG